MIIVECKNLSKDYIVGKVIVKALKNINLKIEEGEFTAIVGPSGSGKTTLLNLLGCLDTPTEGEIYINNILIKNQKKSELAEIRRDYIGFIFQTFNLIPVLTAYENVSFVLSLKKNLTREEIHKRTIKALEEVGLKGMEGRKPFELSGGQQQRVAIARALVKEPALVLADEPTANLDSQNGKSIMELMQNLNKRKRITFVFATHDKMVMDFAKRIITLHDGIIISDKKEQ